MILLGEFGTGLAFAGAAISTWSRINSPISSYCFFFIAFALSCLVLPAHDATIVDLTDPVSRKSYYLLNYWSINFGIGIGAMLGGFLYASYFSLVLLGAGILLGVLGTVSALVLAETLAPAARAQAGRLGTGLFGTLRQFAASFGVVLGDKRYMLLIGAATLAISIEMQMTSYIAVRLARQILPQALIPGFAKVSGPGVIGILRFENTFLVVTLTIAAARIFRNLSDRSRLVGGLAIFTAGFVVLAVANSIWVLILAVAVLTFGELLNVPVKQALMVNSARDSAYGTYLAAYNLTPSVGWVIASLCIPLGALLRPAGMAALYALCGAGAVMIFGRQLRREAQDEHSARIRSVP